MALALAEAGADIAITSRNIEDGRKSARKITQATGRKVLPLCLDVRKEDTMPAVSNPIVIFAQARSGSTVLYRVLQLHPRLNLALEPFCGKYQMWSPDEPNYLELIVDIPTLEEQLAVLFSKYDGFKVLDYQLPEELYTHMLLRPDITVIALRRRNILQQAVSGFIAGQTGIWQKRDLKGDVETAYQGLKPIDLDDLKATIEYACEIRQYYAGILAQKPSHMYLPLCYEDLYTWDVAHNRESFRSVFHFLGLSMPDSQELDNLINPRVEKINNPATYALLPNAKIIDEQFGSDETGWLFEKT